MKKFCMFFATLLMLAMTVVDGYTQVLAVVPQKGVYCWVAPTTNVDGSPLTDLGGYIIRVKQPNVTAPLVIDVGSVTSQPVPPTPSQACPAGTVGVIRDPSTAVEGNYSVTVSAYNTKTPRDESVESTAYAFTVSFNIVPRIKPSAPTGMIVR